MPLGKEQLGSETSKKDHGGKIRIHLNLKVLKPEPIRMIPESFERKTQNPLGSEDSLRH